MLFLGSLRLPNQFIMRHGGPYVCSFNRENEKEQSFLHTVSPKEETPRGPRKGGEQGEG